MDEEERSNLAGLQRKAAEKTPYPYFLERLEEINAWLKAGFSVRHVCQIYVERSVPFPGSYRSFLRYCRKYCQTAAAVEPKASKAPEATPGRAVSSRATFKVETRSCAPPGSTRATSQGSAEQTTSS